MNKSIKLIYSMTKKKINLLIYSYCIIIFSFSLFRFYDLEPSIDQIRHISWALDLINSKGFFGIDLINLNLEDLKHKNTFIINLFGSAYSDIGHIFNIIPILILGIILKLNFDPIISFNFLSISFYILNLFLILKLIRVISLKILKYELGDIDFIILSLFVTVPYYYFFSSLGFHNIGIFFLTFTIYLIETNKRMNFKNFILITMISIFGIFSHKTNIFFIPFIVLMYFFNKYQVKYLVLFISSMIFFLIPILFFLNKAPTAGSSSIYFADFDFSIKSILKNFLIWFLNIGKTLNFGYLTFFILSFFVCAKYFKKFKTLYIIVVLHLLCYLLINSFSVYYLRTNLYLSYTILILIIIFYLDIIKNYDQYVKFIRLLFVVLIIFNFYIFYSPQNLKIVNDEFYNFYFKSNKNLSNFLMFEIDIDNKDKLIVFDDSTKDYLKIVNADIYKNNLILKKPIKNINEENKYNFQYKINNLKNFYLLSISPSDEVIKFKFKNFKTSTNLNNCDIDKSYNKIKSNIINGNYNIYLNKISCN